MGSAGAEGGDAAGPALVLPCTGDADAAGAALLACMGDAAAAGDAAAGAHWKKLTKLCWTCLGFLGAGCASLCLLHASTCLSLLPLLSHCLWQYGHSNSSILTLQHSVHLVKL